MNDTPTVDDVIDRLVIYMLQLADVEQDNQQQTDQLNGMVTGVCMSIAIASGVQGPIDGHDLAILGKAIAEQAADRLAQQQ